jgi:hypothetical protein
MSTLSSSKRIQNDIASHEENSDRRIPSDLYYVIVIEVSSDCDVLAVVKGWLKDRPFHSALVAYVYHHEIYLLFSSVEDKEHYLKGSHQALCSEYASLATLEFEGKTNVKIVELESRTKVLIYFQTKVFENSKRSAQSLSKNTISKKEICQLTFGEIVSALQDRASVAWDKIPLVDRFGMFYKYVLRGEKERFSVLSEHINLQDLEKYTTYFFS